jgi:hypothetical protein
VKSQSVEAVKLLLSANASIKVSNVDGLTPLELAKSGSTAASSEMYKLMSSGTASPTTGMSPSTSSTNLKQLLSGNTTPNILNISLSNLANGEDNHINGKETDILPKLKYNLQRTYGNLEIQATTRNNPEE